MGLADDLGHTHKTSNPLYRALRARGGSRVGAWLFSHTLRHLDDAVGGQRRIRVFVLEPVG